MLKGRVVPVILVCLVLVAGGLRFYRIAEPGFTEGADCMYTETARTLLLLAQWGWHNPDALGSAAETTAGLDAFFAQHAAIPYMPYSAKPLYDFMNVLALAMAGVSDAVLPAMSALMGTLSVIAIFLLGKQLYGERTGLWTAALLTVSGGGLVFSRFAQSHMASLVFFIIGFWFYLRSILPRFSLRALVGSSLFFGFALSTHPNLLPYVGLFALYEVALLFRQVFSWRVFLLRAGVGLGVLVLLGVLLNLPFQIVGYLFGSFLDKMEPQMGWPFMTYFEQLPHHFNLVVTEAAPGLEMHLYTYLGVFVAWEGSIIAVLVLGALLCWLKGLKRASSMIDIIIYSQLVIPLAFWIFSESQPEYRFAAGTLPTALLIAGRKLDRISAFLQNRLGCSLKVAVVPLCLLVMGYSAYNSWPVYRARSAYKEIATWLHAHGQSGVLVHHPRSFRFYGISPVPLNAIGLEQVDYAVFYPLYVTEKEHWVLSVIDGQEPVSKVMDLRPGKLLEVKFAESSLALKLLQGVPVLGKYIGEAREVVLQRNNSRCLELYDIGARKAEIAAVL